MTQNSHLQYLFTHPHYGYLYPHRFALAAFGVPNEYQLNKHRPHLLEGSHYRKLRGDDHIDRLYYSLDGMFRLADLINTPQAMQFKQDLLSFTRGGAIVPATPTDLYQPPVMPSALYAEPLTSIPIDSSFVAPSPLTPSDPAYLVSAPSPCPAFETERSVAQSATAHQKTLNDTAAIIFAAQNLTAHHILAAQEKAKPADVKVTVNLMQQWDEWLNSQDLLAIALMSIFFFTLLGAGSYYFTAFFTRPAPVPQYQSQPQSPWSQP